MTVDLEPRELVSPEANDRMIGDEQDRDRLAALVGPGCDLLDDDEVDRLLGMGRHIAMRLLGEVA
jgi:hypothetical protein